jgi:hypothetical protein
MASRCEQFGQHIHGDVMLAAFHVCDLRLPPASPCGQAPLGQTGGLAGSTKKSRG